MKKKKKKIPKSLRKRTNRSIRRAQFTSFIILLVIGFTISWMLPLRPARSESEKRDLTPFPTLTWKTLYTGAFFDGINLWFSDTFPFREAMVTANGKIKSLYGFGNRLYGLTDHQADEIPQEEQTPVMEPITDLQEIDETLGEAINADNAVVQNLGTLIVVDDAAYEVYNFSQKVADTYAGILNQAASALDGTAHVYDLIVPTSIDITMPDNERAKCNSSSQADAIRYIFSRMTPQVHSVNVYNTLRSHRTEYIYFRTDHHWTARGAYYAYAQFCRTMQLQPKPLSAFKEHVFDGFKGSFVAESRKNVNLVNHPDTVYAYEPNAQTTLVYTEKNGNTVNWRIIGDVTDWYASSKYSTFIGGDHSYTIITNADAPQDKKCMVIKESFGNALVPFIAAEFGEVHVIDYRYWHGSIVDFAKTNGIDTVLYVNNISATRDSSLMKALYSISQ